MMSIYGGTKSVPPCSSLFPQLRDKGGTKCSPLARRGEQGGTAKLKE